MSTMLGTCLTSWESVFSKMYSNHWKIGLWGWKPFVHVACCHVAALLMRGIPHFLGEEVVFIASSWYSKGIIWRWNKCCSENKFSFCPQRYTASEQKYGRTSLRLPHPAGICSLPILHLALDIVWHRILKTWARQEVLDTIWPVWCVSGIFFSPFFQSWKSRASCLA